MRLLVYNIAYGTGTAGGIGTLLTAHRYIRTRKSYMDHIIDFIDESDADVVGLVEIDTGSFRTGFRDQTELVASRLKHYSHCGVKYGIDSIGRRIPILRKQANAFFTRLEAVQAGAYYFPVGFKKLILELNIGGIRFFLVHLALKQSTRRRQLEYLTKIAAINPEPVIIAGDFNAFAGTDEIERLVDLLDLYDYLTGELVSINAQVGLVSQAVSYLTDNAEQYHIDTEKVVLIGHSAGGQLTGCLAERISEHPEEYGYQLAGVVILAGATDFRTMLYEDYHWEGNISLGLMPFIFDGVEDGDIITELEKVDVMSNITEKLPPVLLVHGNNDTVVPLTMSQNLYQSLKELGVDTELVVVQGMTHGLDEQAVSNAIYTYLTAYILDTDEESK